MIARLSKVEDLDSVLRVGLQDFVALHGAEMGDLQMVGDHGSLVIVEAHNLSQEFLNVFRRVHLSSGSACGRAAFDRRPVFIPDVAVDPDYAPYAAFAASVPFSAVLSCPLLQQDGQLAGMISALSAHRFVPTQLELQAANVYASALLSKIIDLVEGADLRAFAERRSGEVLATA